MNKIREDMLKVKRMISEVEIILGKREGETELVNKLIDAQNLLTYCMSRLENAIVPPCKPMPVMSDVNPFNSDVYCPFCGANLSGFYGDEPTSTIQCYGCGEFLDNTKSITREEAEKALAERRDSQ